MADTKITALTAITTVDPAVDVLPIVDVSDTTMAASGTTKKITSNQILGAGGTATLASATITGDLTVRTNKLAVTSTGVGCGTTTPALPFVVSNAGAQGFEINPNGSIISGGIDILSYNRSTSLYKGIGFGAESYLFRVGTVSVSDAMTLNSTGLGVGGSPVSNYRLLSAKTSGGAQLALTTGGLNGSNASPLNIDLDFLGFSNETRARIRSTDQTSDTGNGFLSFWTQNSSTFTEKMRLSTEGNLGIGVTPSAWNSSYRGLQLGSGGAISAHTSASLPWLVATSNSFINSAGDWKFINNGYSTRYLARGDDGTQSWWTSNNGSAGGTVAYTQAMTLDASGRLGVGVSPASNTRTHFKGSSTSTDYINYCVNSSDKLAFGIRNDGLLITGPSADSATLPSSPYNLTTGSAANVFVDSQGIFYRSTSSLKYKTDIADSTRGLADVLKLRPVTYKAKNSGDTVFGGLIAEEVDAAGLTEFVQYAPDNTPDAIHYGNMVSLLVAAIKELTARVQTLETR